MKNAWYYFKICILLLFVSCKADKQDDVVPTEESAINKITVERGAFHYDIFVLEDTVIKFDPRDQGFIEEFPQYSQPSKTIISKSESDELFEAIENKGFFDLEDEYKSQTTDNSLLKVTVEYKGRKKMVFSDDFQRYCPEVLQFIEVEIVRLHGKELVRQILPR